MGIPPAVLLLGGPPPPDPGAPAVAAMKYADLISANAAALAAQKTAHERQADVTAGQERLIAAAMAARDAAVAEVATARAKADSAASARSSALAGAIKQAGGFLVDPAASPPMLYTSDDGRSYSARPIPSAADAVPGGGPVPGPTPHLTPAT